MPANFSQRRAGLQHTGSAELLDTREQMNDTNDPGDRKHGAGPQGPSGRTLSLRRPAVEQGRVRQNFPHGRSKTVVVETKRKRVIQPAKPAESESAAAAKAPSPAPAAAAPRPAPAAASPRPAAGSATPGRRRIRLWRFRYRHHHSPAGTACRARTTVPGESHRTRRRPAAPGRAAGGHSGSAVSRHPGGAGSAATATRCDGRPPGTIRPGESRSRCRRRRP